MKTAEKLDDAVLAQPIDVAQRVNELILAGDYSASAIAKAINYAKSSIANFLSGKYGASTHNVEAALVNWMRLSGIPISEEEYPTRVIETSAIRKMQRVCDVAHRDGWMTAGVSPPGAGKTMGLRAWMARARLADIRHILIQVDVSSTVASLAHKIARELDIDQRGATWAIVERVVNQLLRRPTVILVDEAQHLNIRCLELLRAINDQTAQGIALAGSMALYRTLTDGNRQHIELQQLQDRLHLVEMIGSLSPVEVATFVRDWWGSPVDTEVVGRLRACSNSSPRRLTRILMHARTMCAESTRPLSLEIVDQADRMLYRREEVANA